MKRHVNTTMRSTMPTLVGQILFMNVTWKYKKTIFYEYWKGRVLPNNIGSCRDEQSGAIIICRRLKVITLIVD